MRIVFHSSSTRLQERFYRGSWKLNIDGHRNYSTFTYLHLTNNDWLTIQHAWRVFQAEKHGPSPPLLSSYLRSCCNTAYKRKQVPFSLQIRASRGVQIIRCVCRTIVCFRWNRVERAPFCTFEAHSFGVTIHVASRCLQR